MTVAVWIIAVVEVIRAIQNMMQLFMVKRGISADEALETFIVKEYINFHLITE